MTVLGVFARRSEERAISSVPWGEWPGEGGATYSGPRVDTTSALRLLTVYGCNRFICEGISTLPVDVFRKSDEGSRPAPAPLWVEQPTVELNRVAWLTQVLTSLLLDGDAFLRLVYSGPRMELVELVPLDPMAVNVRRNDRTKRREYVIGGTPVDPFEILHIPGLMRPGADRGMSPVEAARQTVGSGLAIKEFAGRFFSQGMNPAGVVETQGEMAPQKAKDLANAIRRRHGGRQNAHLPLVLENATWKVTGVTNEQAQFLQTQQFTAAEIASFMFLIDPTEFGVSIDKGSSITYANLEQRNARKVSVTFLPWIVRIEHALSKLLNPGTFLKFNVNGLLRGDLKTRYDSYAVGIDNGFLTVNEARAFEELEPLEDDDDDDETRRLSVPEAVQKVYLGVGKVITSDEARQIVNDVGGDLNVPGPEFPASTGGIP